METRDDFNIIQGFQHYSVIVCACRHMHSCVCASFSLCMCPSVMYACVCMHVCACLHVSMNAVVHVM